MIKQGTNQEKLPSLNGWRAISIGMVLLAHSTFVPGFPAEKLNNLILGWLNLGTVGVRFFFVISGFLITYLMLQEKKQTGHVDLRHFYIRRGLRILPVYCVYLLVLGLGTHYSQPPAAWLANITFTTNFFEIPHPTEHFWSLAVEEQFYLLWPWFVWFALGRNQSPRNLLRILVIPIVIAPAVRLLQCKGWYPHSLRILFVDGSFFAVFDWLAFGCLAAVILAEWRSRLESMFRQNLHRIAWLGLAMIMAPTFFRMVHVPGRLQALSADSIQATGFTLLLLQSLFLPSTGFYRLLNWKVINHIGVLSYSIYIWQQMFCGTANSVFGRNESWWLNFPWWILIALVVAHASYYLLERPLLKLRAKYRQTRASPENSIQPVPSARSTASP